MKYPFSRAAGEPTASLSYRTLVHPFHGADAAQIARATINARERRRVYFKASLFSDPAWDILLELFVAECSGRRSPISAVGHAAGIPPTTALRWINALQREGLVTREDDPHDRRRSFLNLTDRGIRSMRACLGSNPSYGADSNAVRQ